ncbi:MAG: hypothetical protein ABH860_04895 [bacterium]
MEVKGVGPGGPIHPEDIERERLKEIKTRIGKVAFLTALGKDARVSRVSPGIAGSEGALKWIEEVFGQEKWKDS